ncbi:MAG: hypothetical protein M1812_000774 [Candelaria pacifica]|nr:MAG: hypothetical protein M1812_000774 [Candelaria pacifica]
MLALKAQEKELDKCIPNVLPCRIDHNGPVNASERYWAPTKEDDGKEISYFRGRKLYGKSVKTPEGYRGKGPTAAIGQRLTSVGIVATTTETKLPENSNRDKISDVSNRDVRMSEDDEDGDEAESEAAKILEENAAFDEIVVWGHEAVPETESDPYIKGMDEWISFAETMHAYPSKGSAEDRDPKKVG